jgi:hypothetical protein
MHPSSETWGKEIEDAGKQIHPNHWIMKRADNHLPLQAGAMRNSGRDGVYGLIIMAVLLPTMCDSRQHPAEPFLGLLVSGR